MMGYYLGSHLPVRELQQGIKGSYCPDYSLLGDQYSMLALDLVKREKETCPDFFFSPRKDLSQIIKSHKHIYQQ